MSANRIFLVCSHHPQVENSLLLGERAEGSATFEAPNLKRIDEWFKKHANCGNPDDIQLAYHRPVNWDVSPPAPETAIGVRLALISGNTQ